MIFNLFSILLVSHSLTTQQVFEKIYRDKSWGTNSEGAGHSGGGSSLRETQEYRLFLEDFLSANEIKSVVDLGCGDWEFSRYINWMGINYLGVDIVESVIKNNIQRYASSNISFSHMIDVGGLPPADLLICKDVLQHLSLEEINKILKQIPKYKYCLFTNDIQNSVVVNRVNSEIKAGECRTINLTLPPFLLKGYTALTYKTSFTTKVVFLIID